VALGRPAEGPAQGGRRTATANLEASERFGTVERRNYLWERQYTGDSYVTELATHSDHHRLAREIATPLYDAIAHVIEAAAGITVTMRTALITAKTLG
jgi:hypothetical protein